MDAPKALQLLPMEDYDRRLQQVLDDNVGNLSTVQITAGRCPQCRETHIDIDAAGFVLSGAAKIALLERAKQAVLTEMVERGEIAEMNTAAH